MLVTSPADKEAFLSLRPEENGSESVSVIPNGVDLSYFQPGPDSLRERDTIVISGKMSYHANVSMTLHLVQDILPLVWERLPGVRLWVVGKDPARELQALGDHPNITITGGVPDLRPYLQRASLSVAPIIYGAGIQNKILEAMACGTPVITTSLATTAIRACKGEDLKVADGPRAFADTIIALLNDPPERQAIGRAGRAYVEREHDWSSIAASLEEIYLQEASSRQTPI
jgi:glycosyltransferase involved in cell wall biosynthesis